MTRSIRPAAAPEAGRRLLAALDQLDPGHGRTVALAWPQLQDTCVATVPVLEPRSDLMEQPGDHVAIGDVLQDGAPGGQIPSPGLRDQPFGVRTERLRLRLGRVDRL